MIPFNQRKVLVLNKTWSAINFCTLRRAICSVMSNYKSIPKAEIADMDENQNYHTYIWDEWKELPVIGDEYISGGNAKYRIPKIIITVDYNKLPQNQSKFGKKLILRRDNNTCMYCGLQPGLSELNIDHVVPKSKGGLSTWLNCVTSCIACNKKKADLTLEQAGMKLLKQPYKPSYRLIPPHYRDEAWKPFLPK